MDKSTSTAILFWACLTGLATVVHYYKIKDEHEKKIEVKVSSVKKKVEGFQSAPPPKIQFLSPKPSDLPGQLPSAPFGEISTGSPLPYKNPVNEKARLVQINGILEDLRGYLGFEAKQLEDRSDPSIQLPLQRLKGDFQRLSDETRVISQNPGIESQLTQGDMESIRANLRYLQRESRTIDMNTVEGFYGGDNQGYNQRDNSGKKATKDDLSELVLKFFVEIQRLSISGTSDPVTNARINSLNRMRQDVMDILQKINKGDLREEDIPIYKSDITQLLPLLGQSGNQPLPQLIKKAGLSPILASLLPNGYSNNGITNGINDEIIRKYLDKLLEGLSWKIEIEYTSNNKKYNGVGSGAGSFEQDTNGNTNSNNKQSLFQSGFPSLGEIDNTGNPNAKFSPNEINPSREFLPFIKTSADEFKLAESIQKQQMEPARFNWKERGQQIRESIRQNGLEPKEFGCLSANEDNQVSHDFSWRGYCKMICSRLGHTMDPGLPETCGCPPEGWKGWKS